VPGCAREQPAGQSRPQWCPNCVLKVSGKGIAGSRRLCYCLFSRTKEPAAKLLVLLETGKARILSATVSPEADRWFASLTCEVERQPASPARREGEPVGVDLGLDCFAVLSDGTRIAAPKPLKKALKPLRCRSGQLSRRQKGSKTTLRLSSG